HRVEQLLLDRCVHRELLDDAVDDPALLDEGAVSRLFVALEQLLDGLVVIFQQGDGIHTSRLPTVGPLQRMETDDTRATAASTRPQWPDAGAARGHHRARRRHLA